MAVVHGFDLVQRPVEERREVVLLASGGERGHDLIQVEVGEEVRLLAAPSIAFAGRLEQDALEYGRRD